MAAQPANSRLNGWFWPVLLAIGGCSGAVAPERSATEAESSSGDAGAVTLAGGAGPGANSSPSEPAGTASDPADGGALPEPSGNSAPPPAPNPAIAPTTFACEPATPTGSTPLRRLSAKQYANSIRDALVFVVGDTATVDEAMPMLLDDLPSDDRLALPQDRHGTYRRLDQRVQQPHVDAWFASATNVGKWLSEPERLTAVLGDCERFVDSAACVRAFVARFGRIAFRRPLDAEDVDFYYGFYEPSTAIDGAPIDSAGMADVVAGMLNAPDFLYLVEGRGEPSPEAAQHLELTAHELAARLSYHFWNTLPDEELSQLADSGELLDQDVYRAQVDRLFADERAADSVAEFYAEWLGLEDLSPLDRNNDSPLFQAFAGEHLPSAQLASAMRDEVSALLGYYTFEEPGGVVDILTTPNSFATSVELARLYGVEVWSGQGAPPRFDTARPGLLTRAAFLATGTANTRPIMRGLFVRTNLLCDAIASPPAEAGATPPELSPNLTTREVVEQLTASTACSGCHDALINPLGFALEGFDSLGRARTEQRLFDDQGNEIGAKPVDTTSVPQVVLGDATVSRGPEDLMQLLSASGKVEACLARQYFRFTFGRWEHVATDGCALEQMRQALGVHGTLGNLLREVALSAAFRTRTMTLEEPVPPGGGP